MKTSNPVSVCRIFLALVAGLLFSGTSHSQAVPEAGLVGYWRGDGNANDSSPNANHGSFSGAYETGCFGMAFRATTGVSIPDSSAYNFTTAFSVGFWFYGTPSSGGVFVGHDDGPYTRDKWLVYYDGTFNIHLNGPGSTIIRSNPVTPAQAWHQFSLVKDGNTYMFYLDGAPIGSQVDTTPFPDPSSPLTIGIGEGAYLYNGLIDEVVLYNRALSASEVQALSAEDKDLDGIADRFETGTGIFVSAEDTGTSPTHADSDGDGLKDGQEVFTYHTNPNLPDTDGDGFLDLYEIRCGKSPTDANDKPALIVQTSPAIEFTFPSATGKVYRIEASPDLLNWAAIEADIHGTGGEVQRFYSTKGIPKRFLRVEESAP